MSDGIHPTGPSQPTLDTVYSTAGNQVDQEPAEKKEAASNAGSDAPIVETRDGTKHDDATPTSVARGVRGAPAGEERKGLTHQDVGRSNELDGEQMAAPGEGKIAAAVENKPGATGSEPGLESDLDRKKAEQAPLREEKKAERQEKVDVAGVLGQTGGPANPVDKNGYPNASS